MCFSWERRRSGWGFKQAEEWEEEEGEIQVRILARRDGATAGYLSNVFGPTARQGDGG